MAVAVAVAVADDVGCVCGPGNGWPQDLWIGVVDHVGALGDEQLDSLGIGLGQAGDADVGACRAHLQGGEAQRSLDRAAVDVDMLDTAERQRLDPMGHHAAAQRQIVLAELIRESPHLQHAEYSDQREQQKDTTADQQRQKRLTGPRGDHDGADGDDGGRQCNAGQAHSEVAGVDGHECVIGEPREVIGRDRFVAERIGHACFLATTGRIRSSAGMSDQHGSARRIGTRVLSGTGRAGTARGRWS